LSREVPPELLGAIMSSYFGGRSEVRIRREIVRVLYCDFKSMYPTVCTLMSLWKFVIAKEVKCEEATEETIDLLVAVRLGGLQSPDFWRRLPVLVQVVPNADIFPVRAAYLSEAERTIGINYVSSDNPLWFTLADCVASKLLTGNTPQVLRAIRFAPGRVQPGLEPINIAGNSAFHIDPTSDDFFRRLVELRDEAKRQAKSAELAGDEALSEHWSAIAQAAKVCVNGTSYGIFAELNVVELNDAVKVQCYGSDTSFETEPLKSVEEPGRYFHPLLATLTTGAARLMLAITARLAEDSGISWAFCDTDSMALARPKGMRDETFLRACKNIVDWFAPLNPYEHKDEGSLKIEDANYSLSDGKPTNKLEPLRSGTRCSTRTKKATTCEGSPATVLAICCRHTRKRKHQTLFRLPKSH
jgi:DNA polymerase elongation subunit (family B)